MNHQTPTPVNYKKHMRFDMTALVENNISIKSCQQIAKIGFFKHFKSR
ncbi:hypothetical protein M23134_03872 [Microscilla marina ATCC 23134]|uniref:Uncharacterized protein n=1 Tax=Microscilla marina ATCC 23134 TaxID=313606 RepID=A1ZME0_MICM2|nr:hypothetical protein M23134_03872 [Microscilla marina ATCC 23134]